MKIQKQKKLLNLYFFTSFDFINKMLFNHPLAKTFYHILCPRHNCVPYGS